MICIGIMGFIILAVSFVAIAVVVPVAFLSVVNLLKECFCHGASDGFFEKGLARVAVILQIAYFPMRIGCYLSDAFLKYIENWAIYKVGIYWIHSARSYAIVFWIVSFVICIITEFFTDPLLKKSKSTWVYGGVLLLSVLLCLLAIVSPIWLWNMDFCTQSVNGQTKAVSTNKQSSKTGSVGEYQPNDNWIDAPEGATYVINMKSGKVHRFDCGTAYNAYNTETFEFTYKSHSELVSEGYSPCGNCNP